MYKNVLHNLISKRTHHDNFTKSKNLINHIIIAQTLIWIFSSRNDNFQGIGEGILRDRKVQWWEGGYWKKMQNVVMISSGINILKIPEIVINYTNYTFSKLKTGKYILQSKYDQAKPFVVA